MKNLLLSFCLALTLILTSQNLHAAPKPKPQSNPAPAAAAPAPAQPETKKQAKGNPKSLKVNEEGIALVKQKRYPEAELKFQEALKIDSGNLSAVFNLANMYIFNKKQAQAIALLVDYTSRTKDDAGLFAKLGDAYFSSRQPAKAMESYEQALKIAPDYQGVPTKLGGLYVMNGKLEKAEQMLTQAVRQNPKDSQAYSNLASVLLANKKAQESIQAAKISVQLKPSREVYVTLGNAYESIKDNKNAVIAFKRAQDLGTENPELKNKIAELEKTS